MMKLIYLLLISILSIPCKSQEKAFYNFDPRSIKENKITLAEIADDITYIPLDNSFPIGIIYSYKFTNNSIYLTAKDIGIMSFNREGKLINKIGSIGRGPGEYYYCMNFDIDPKSENVYLLDINTIKVFAKNGSYKRSIKLAEYDLRFNDIDFLNGKLIISENIYAGKSKYCWLILDTTGILLKKKYNPIPAFKSNLNSGGGAYIFANRISYWDWYNDTVYSILPDLSYSIEFLLSPGDHRWPKSMLQGTTPSETTTFLKKFFTLGLLFETNRFLVMRYFYKNPIIALIDKTNRKSFISYCEIEKGTGNPLGGIVNNIDGGIPFQPETYFEENGVEYMVAVINPYQLKTHVLSNEFANSTPEYPVKKKNLEKLANSLKETDNPILMTVRLKK